MNAKDSSSPGVWTVLRALFTRLFKRKKKRPSTIYPLR
jgi:hypothetical protein